MPVLNMRSPVEIRLAISMVVVANVLTCIICITFAIHLQHKWCGLLYNIEAPNIPRPTATGREWQRQIHNFRTRDIGC